MCKEWEQNRPQVDEILRSCGGADWGTCALDGIPLSPEAREKVEALCPDAKGVFCLAFPYYAGNKPGNLSLYARGEDYHQAIARRLETACAALSALFPGRRFLPGVDNSPLPEREIARQAGLGIIGRNGLVILPPYGSWIFLGTILTDLPLPSAAEPSSGCMNCGACVRACPGGALREQPFDEGKCLSALTQQKGELTAAQEALLRAHPLIWGCDICQQVCPYNREAICSPLFDLTGQGEVPYVASLTLEELEGLTNRTFRAAYGNRAFSWRGPSVIRRNLTLKLRN
jgi:epoxyqueuosine reductase QueG